MSSKRQAEEYPTNISPSKKMKKDESKENELSKELQELSKERQDLGKMEAEENQLLPRFDLEGESLWNTETKNDVNSLLEEAALKDWEQIVIAKFLQHLESESMAAGEKKVLRGFITALGNSSLRIQERKENTGISSIYLVLTSGVTPQGSEELFAPSSTNVRALLASLAFASTFIPAMVVKYYRIFSKKSISMLASVPLITLEWRTETEPESKSIVIHVPRGEIQHFWRKAEHQVWGTKEWMWSLVRPMQLYLEREGTLWSMNRDSHHLERNRRMDKDGNDSIEFAEKITSITQSSFCYYAKNVLLTKETQRAFFQKALKGLTLCSNHAPTTGSALPYRSDGFWYFKKR